MKNSSGGTARPPADLSPEAKVWFRQLVDEYSIEDRGGVLLLITAMRAFDRAESARSLLDSEGIVVRDKFGQTKPHPAAAIERDSRSGLLQALKALRLDVDPFAGKSRGSNG